MFTFGYKTTLSSILRSLASIGIGLVMIFVLPLMFPFSP